jgi:hypothetical protein
MADENPTDRRDDAPDNDNGTRLASHDRLSLYRVETNVTTTVYRLELYAPDHGVVKWFFTELEHQPRGQTVLSRGRHGTGTIPAGAMRALCSEAFDTPDPDLQAEGQ